jgi:hypothetical protein
MPILTSFTFPLSPVLQFIVLPLNYSFCHFSSTLYPCLHLPLLSFPNLSPHYLSLLHTHNKLTSLLYQLYTIPPHNTFHYNTTSHHLTEMHPNTLNGHKTQQPPHLFLHPPTLLMPPLPISQISTSSLITITPSQLPLYIIITKGFSI